MQKVLVVEDDTSIREMLLYALKSSGFEAVGIANGDELLASLNKEKPQLVLLDIMLPGTDGLSLLSSIRESVPHKRTPVIMLTAKGTELDRIKGLELGADDYVVKPFSVMEVLARVKAVLRRTEDDQEIMPDLVAGPIVLNLEKRSVSVEGEEVTLTFKEFELLNYLMKKNGIVLSRERLLEKVWGYNYAGESRTVDMHIKSLRQKLGVHAELIKTVRNVGYKLEA